jgi:hypothetical protein
MEGQVKTLKAIAIFAWQVVQLEQIDASVILCRSPYLTGHMFDWCILWWGMTLQDDLRWQIEASTVPNTNLTFVYYHTRCFFFVLSPSPYLAGIFLTGVRVMWGMTL